VLLAVISIGCQISLHESSAEQATIALPSGVDFGMQQIRQASMERVITIAPAAGAQSDMITAVSARCPDFTINAANLPAPVSRVCRTVTCPGGVCQSPDETGVNATCQTSELRTYDFGATFTPTIRGTVSCVVTVTLNSSTTRTVTLTGTGVPPAIAADVQPASVAFGEVRSGSASTVATIAVRSSGSQPLDVQSASTSGGFTILSGPTTAYALAASATQDYKVACSPVAVGDMTGQFEVRTSDPLQARIAVDLACTGTDSALGITPSPVTLDTTRVGEPVVTTVDLRNTGTAPMTLERISVDGDDISTIAGPQLPMSLARPTDVARVAVRFHASKSGEFKAALTALYDGGKRRSTQITARALGTSLSVSPDGDVDFGPVCVGQRKTRDFVVLANDQGWFRLGSISDPGAPFSVTTDDPLPVAMQGSGASQFVFHVIAAPELVGAAAATTAVQTDIPHGTDHTLNLSVLGLPAGGVTATPDSLDLGSLEINTTAIGKEIHLSNCSASPIEYSNARIEGRDASDFAIVAAPSAPMIAPSGLVSWLVVLQAHSPGPKQATFSVDFDSGTESVDLLGEGLPVADPPRGSYYACSTGQPTALWPIALALLALRRRRIR
jgi:MYXO-CTERM domain-containing protein